jgi:hypothetical protein
MKLTEEIREWRANHKIATALIDGAVIYTGANAAALALDAFVQPQQGIIQTANAEEVTRTDTIDNKTVKTTDTEITETKPTEEAKRPALIYAEASAGKEVMTLDTKLTIPLDRINEKLDGFRFFTRQRATIDYDGTDPIKYMGIFELGYEAFKGFDVVVDAWGTGKGFSPHAGAIYKNKWGPFSLFSLAKVTLMEESGFTGQIVLCYSPEIAKDLKLVIRGEEVAMPTFDGEGMKNIFRGRTGFRYKSAEAGAFLDATTIFTEKYDKSTTELIPGGYFALYFKSTK